MKKKILIVLADYYPDISKNLLNNALKYLISNKNSKLNKKDIKLIKVPGVFEIPVVVALNVKKYDGILALGCVIKGETPHFEFISKATTDAIMRISVDNRKPIGNGILTCLNKKQANVRSKTKGQETAKAVNSVLNLKQ